jgi:hypothetical protein
MLRLQEQKISKFTQTLQINWDRSVQCLTFLTFAQVKMLRFRLLVVLHGITWCLIVLILMDYMQNSFKLLQLQVISHLQMTNNFSLCSQSQEGQGQMLN